MGKYIETNRGLEAHRQERLRTVPTFEPIIAARYPEEGTYLLIDGSHRYVEALRRKDEWILAYLLEPSQWEPFTVDAPLLSEERLLNRRSGL